MNLETGTCEFTRDVSAYFDVTSFVGSNFSYAIIDLIEPDILKIELTINNVSSLTVYDVCVVFKELYGKEVLETFCYIDFFEPFDPDPVINFRTEDENREFPPMSDTENLYLKYPAGASPYIDFSILAHMGGNTGGVYQLIASAYEGTLYPDGGSAILSGYVWDHQDDVQMVVADTSVITGGYTFLDPTPDPLIWQAEITNSQGAPSGNYYCWIMASSPSSPQYNTYYEFLIIVSHYPTTLYVDDDNTTGPWDGSIDHPFQYIQDAVDYAVDGDTIWVKPGIYYEDPGGSPSSRKAEIEIDWINDLTLYGEGMPVIYLHNYEGDLKPAAIDSAACNNLVIDGFEFTAEGNYGYVIDILSGSNNQIRNCKMTPAPSHGFKGFVMANSSSGVIIENNCCDNVMVNPPDEYSFNFIYLTSCQNSKVTLNTIRNLQQSSVPHSDSTYEMTLIYAVNSSNTEFNKNILGDFNWSFDVPSILTVTGIFAGMSTNCDIRNNLIYDFNCVFNAEINQVSAIVINMSSGGQCIQNTIEDLYISSTTSGYCVGMELIDTSIIDLFNNIITRIGADNYNSACGISSNVSVIQDFSDVWNCYGVVGYRYGGSATEGLNCLDADPEYVDPDNDDYHLQPGSPCEGHGFMGHDMGCYGGDDPLP